MQTPLTPGQHRVAHFAKILAHEGRQILLYLYRADDDEIHIAVQMWVAETDEQLRVDVFTQLGEDAVLEVFDHITQDSLGTFLEGAGILATLQDREGLV